MKLIPLIFCFMLLSFSCKKKQVSTSQPEDITVQVVDQTISKQKDGTTIITRFEAPIGYQTVQSASNSFGAFLQNLPLKPDGELVTYYNGGKKQNRNVYDAVVDLPIGTKDLHQCADAVMRLRADYLKNAGREDEIAFHFTNGFLAEYKKWKAGNRIVVNGNQVSWAAGNSNKDDYWKYLEQVFTYAGTLSLSKELKSKSMNDLNIGDVFIRGGSPGHAVIVVNKAVNPETNHVVYMLAQSYMPAQEIQVLLNPENDTVWYSVTNDEKINTPEWTFDKSQLCYFEN